MEGREALKRLPGRERSKFRLSETLSNSACLGESTALVAAGTPTVPRLDLWWVSGQLEGMGGAQAEVTISDEEELRSSRPFEVPSAAAPDDKGSSLQDAGSDVDLDEILCEGADLTHLSQAPVVPAAVVTPREPTGRFRVVSYTALLVLVLVSTASSGFVAPLLPLEAQRRSISPIYVGVLVALQALSACLSGILHNKLLHKSVLTKRMLLLAGLCTALAASTIFALSSWIPDDCRTAFVAATALACIFQGTGAAGIETASMFIATQFYVGPTLGHASTLVEGALSLGWILGPLSAGMLSSYSNFGLTWLAAAALIIHLTPMVALLPAEPPGAFYPDSTALVGSTEISSVLKLPRVLLLLLISGCSLAAVASLDAVLGPFLAAAVGAGPLSIGISLSVISITYTAAVAACRWITSRSRPAVPVILGLIMSVAAASLLAMMPQISLLPPVPGIQQTCSVLAVMTFGCGLAATPILLAATRILRRAREDTPAKKRAIGCLVARFSSTGGCLGPIVGGALTSTVGYKWAATGCAAVLLVLLVLQLLSVAVPSGTRGFPSRTTNDVYQIDLLSEDEEAMQYAYETDLFFREDTAGLCTAV